MRRGVLAGLVAVAAARLVLLVRAHDDRRARVRRGPAVDQPLRRRRAAAAAVADRLQLVDELGVGQELRHRPEREPPEVLVEPGRDHPGAVVGELERDADDLFVEELGLVDADHLEAARPLGELGHARHRHGPHPDAGVADDVGGVVAVVDPRLEDHRPLAGDLGAPEPADHLLALAAEHRAADDLEPAAALRVDPDHGRDRSRLSGRRGRDRRSARGDRMNHPVKIRRASRARPCGRS